MLIDFIKKFEKKKITVAQKRAEIRNSLIKFFEDLDATNGYKLNIPAFIRAEEIMNKKVKTNKDVEFYYENLLKYGWFKRNNRGFICN